MSQVIIITGMHRSGTSLITSLVQRAGIHVGEKLLAASSANPSGYFEDVDFLEFHDQLLHERGQTYLHVNTDFKFDPTFTEMDRARRLIAARIHRPVWGWKDPRTSLFLDFWIKLLPDARFLFVYRHPIEVLLSLLRRGEFESHPTFMAGLNAWHTYNTNILKVCDQLPGRCLLVHIDGVTKRPAQFVHLLKDKLQLDPCLEPDAFEKIYHAEELQKTPFSPELSSILAKLYPELLEVYQQLNLRAELRSDDTCTDSSSSSSRFSSLAHFTESLAEPISLPVRHSLLQLLLGLFAPEPTESILSRFNECTKKVQLEVGQHWLHAQNLHRRNVEQGQELEQRLGQIAEQNQELDRLQQFNAERQLELDRMQRLDAEQKLELDRLQRLGSEQKTELDRLQQFNAERQLELDRMQRLDSEQKTELGRLHRLDSEQKTELDRLQRLSAQQSLTLDSLQWLNMEQIQELEQQSVRIESLLAELDNIHGTRVWKAIESYRKFKSRWKNAA